MFVPLPLRHDDQPAATDFDPGSTDPSDLSDLSDPSDPSDPSDQ
jgi:hypothetical protein